MFFNLGYISLSWHTCYVVRDGALGILEGGATHSLHCGSVCGGGVQEGTMPLAQLLASFKSLLPLLTNILGFSGADSRLGGFVYVLGPCGSLQQTLL